MGEFKMKNKKILCSVLALSLSLSSSQLLQPLQVQVKTNDTSVISQSQPLTPNQYKNWL